MPIFQIEHGGQTLEIDSANEPSPTDLEAILNPASAPSEQPKPESRSRGAGGEWGSFQPDEKTLSAAPEPSLLSRAGTAVRESLPATFLLGETKNQQLARGQAREELRMQAPGLATLLEHHEATTPQSEFEKPIVNLPTLPEITPVEGQPLSALEKAGSVGAGAYNAAAPVVSSFTSPKNIAILIGTAGAGTAARGLIAGLFGATMASDVVEQIPEAKKVLDNPAATIQEKTQAVASPVITAVMASLASLGAVHELRPGITELLRDKPAPEAVKVLREEAAKSQIPAEKNAFADAATKIEDANAISELKKAGVEIETPPTPEIERLSSTPDGVKKLTDIQDALKSPDTVIQYSVWDKEMMPPGADRTAQVDLINPKDTESLGGIASTNRALLQELGVDAPAAPDSLAPGRYTLDEIKAAIAKEAEGKASMLDSQSFEAQWREQGGQGGSENQVVMKDGRVYKRNYNNKLGQALPNYEGNLAAFEDHVALHNELFPSTKITIEGSSQTSDGPAPVVSQKQIIGKEASFADIKQLMEGKGFKHAGGDNWFNPETGIRVNDLSGRNVLKSADGEIHVIDPVIKRTQPKAVPSDPSVSAPAEVGLGAAAPAEFRPVRESSTSLKNAAVDAERKARGAPPLMEVARKDNPTLWDQAMKVIDDNQNIADDLISTLKEKPRATTDVEQVILLHREIDLKNQLDRVTKNLSEKIGTEDSLASDRLNRARILDELSTLEEASQAAGTETSRGLNARKLIAKEDFSLAKMLTERRAEKGGSKLSETEIAEVEKQHADIEEAQRALDQYEAQQELADAITTPEEANALIDKLRKQVREADQTQKPAPKSKEETRLNQFKIRTQKQIDIIRKKISDGDFSEKAAREPIKLDEEALRLKAELQRAKGKFQEILLKDRIAQRSLFERAQDTFVRWRRGFLLSSPVTLAKLSSAAVQRMVFTPLEELVGAGIGKLIPSIASRAPREGGFNVNAEARAITQGITKGMSDAAELLRTGKTNLEVLFGKGREGGVKESDVTPRSIIDLFGEIHGALKAPVKRAEFARSLEKRMAFGIRNGVDVTDPAIQTKLMVQAYKDANRSIFLQDNIVVDAYNRALGALLQKQKSTGRTSTAGKLLATTAKTLLPIVRVPTNIVAETIQVATGTITGSYRLARALGREAKNLSPEEADLILRDLKKGSLGVALLAMGYFNADKIGGYYQSGQKRSDKDVQYGSIKVGGATLPSYLLHNPLIEALQIGATIRRVADSKHLKKDKDTQGVAAGTLAAALGLIEEVPFVRQQVETAKMLDSREGPYARGNFVKSLAVPSLVDWTARQMDKDKNGNTIQRKPSTVLQHVETGIPGLRQKVPTRSGATQMGQPPPK